MEAQEYLHKEFTTLVSDIEIMNDSGWGKPVRAGRSIKDYFRTIQFSRLLTKEELQQLQDILRSKYCPGWTGASLNKKEEKTYSYTFVSTHDTSD